MSPKKKALFIAQEITPYLKNSPLGDLSRLTATRVAENGYEVRMFMPKYGAVNERRNQLHEVIRLSGQNIPIDDTDHPLVLKVATLAAQRIQVYFIDNEDYFHRNVTRLETEEFPADNDERAIFFTRGVIETAKKLKWEPVVVHSMGWLSALVPLYLRKAYADDPTMGGAKVVYGITSGTFEGTLDPRFREKLLADGFTADDLRPLGNDDADVDVNALHRLAIAYCDGVVADVETLPAELLAYAKELGKPILPYEQRIEGLPDFYDTL